jgi:WD40 repeat protein
VRVWPAADGGEPLVLRGHEGSVTSVAFAPDGLLASGGEDGTVRVWLAAGGPPLVLQGHEVTVMSVAFAADGRLASGGWDGTVRIWSDAESEPLVLRGHEGWVGSVAFAADGRLASGGEDGTVRVVWIGPSDEELVAEARRRLPRELTEAEERRFYLRAR